MITKSCYSFIFSLTWFGDIDEKREAAQRTIISRSFVDGTSE